MNRQQRRAAARATSLPGLTPTRPSPLSTITIVLDHGSQSLSLILAGPAQLDPSIVPPTLRALADQMAPTSPIILPPR